MNIKEKFMVGWKVAYKAAFHKKFILGKMGCIYDELEVVGNAVNYMKYSNNNIKICKSDNEKCNEGIDTFVRKRYDEAYKIFEEIPDEFQSVKNYLMAVCCLYGKGTKKNVAKGFKLAKNGADQSLCCKQLLARCYIEGVGIPVNKDKAYNLFCDVLRQLESCEQTDIDDDYMMPDIYYFCGEYELEKKNFKNGVEHLKTAALGKNFGLAYYLLGKYYFESEPEQAYLYFDKAKQLNVNVSTRYYDRSDVIDEPIDLGVNEKLQSYSDGVEHISNISDMAVNIKKNVEKFNKDKIIKKRVDAERERIESETELKMAKADDAIADKKIETMGLKAEAECLDAERKKKRREEKVKRK